MKESKTLEYRIKPNKEQKILIWKTFGCCRFVYNHLLAERIEYEKIHKGKVNNTTPAHLKELYQFLKEVDSLSLANTQLNVNRACKNQFFKDKVPAFRRKGKDKRSYTTNVVNNNIRIDSSSDIENYIKLPKLGLVKIILHRDIPTDWIMKHITIKETASGKFFISLIFDVEKQEVERKGATKVEALDFSMPQLIVSASGDFDVSSDYTHYYRDLEERIARECRKLSKMKYGSANYYKQLHRVGKLYEKAANRRKDFLHKLSYAIANSNDIVILEDINLQAMSKSLHFGKAIHDNGFGMFRTFLLYKLNDRGKILIKVDKFFPSTQRCSNCHAINPATKDLSVREWICPVCNTKHSRDKNSCSNLLQEGKNIYNRWANGDSSLILTPQGVLSEKKLHLQKRQF